MSVLASSHGIQPLKINDENKYILFCKVAFSDILRGEKKFSRGQPPDPIFNMVPLEEKKMHFDLLPQVFYMLEYPAFSWITTSVPPPSADGYIVFI